MSQPRHEIVPDFKLAEKAMIMSVEVSSWVEVRSQYDCKLKVFH